MTKWLRIWAYLTVAATFGLLVLGTLVTSFKVGMADPIWPTEPWRLALIDWSEPSTGFLIEHTHRLVGFTVGGLMAILALGIWWTEPRAGIRAGGSLSLIALLGAFGWLHGVLIRQTKELAPGTALTVPPSVAGVLALAALAAFVAACATAATQSPLWSVRVLAVGLLLGVMIQGLFGGLRVHLNALYGENLALVHGAFSQVIFGMSVLVALLLGERRGVSPTWKHSENADSTSGLRLDARLNFTWAIVAALTLYAQIVAGALLRHTTSTLGPRLHLILAFIATFSLVVAGMRLWRAHVARLAVTLAFAVLTVQIGLGVESWMTRFTQGFTANAWQQITFASAMLRSAHVVTGYLLFALSIALVTAASRSLMSNKARSTRVLEGVA